MLRALSKRLPLGLLSSPRHISRVTTRFASTTGGKPTNEATTPSTSTQPPPTEVNKTVEPPKTVNPQQQTTKQPEPNQTGSAGGNNNNNNNNNNTGKEKPKGKSSRWAVYGGVLVVGAVATEEILEHWGVFSTRDFLRTQYGISLFPESPTAAVRHPHEQADHELGPSTPTPAPETVPGVAAEIATDPVLVNPVSQSSVAVEIIPLPQPDEIPAEVVEITPVEILDVIVQQENPPATQDKTSPPPPTTPEQVLTELLNEISENAPPVPAIPAPPPVDFHALLTAQAEQLEALREKLQQYYTESHQELDYKAKAHEAAYRETLEIRERVYRAELEAKLAQLQAELQAKFESLREQERNQIHLHFQQQYEQQKAESERQMAEALKTAVENVATQYSVRLAEEINKLDSKVTEALANEDAKYTASAESRARVLDQLRAKVTHLEAVLVSNSAKLKESLNLHDISAALYDLSTTSLASPVRVSFKAELDKLETLSKTLPGGGDAVVTTVAEVLRPIANEGVASYSELTSRFKTVLASGRQAALVPEGGGVMGNLVAAVASKLIIPAKGPVVGDTPEAIFAQAEYHLEHGELHKAVDQLSKLHGMPASIVRDWLQAASDRLVVENSLKALHAHVIVLTHQHQHQINDVHAA